MTTTAALKTKRFMIDLVSNERRERGLRLGPVFRSLLIGMA